MKISTRIHWAPASAVALLVLILLAPGLRLGWATPTSVTTPTVTVSAAPTASPSGLAGTTQKPGDEISLKQQQEERAEKLRTVLWVIALCGAFGGIADGLKTNLRYRLMVPGSHRVRYRFSDAGAAAPSPASRGAAPPKAATETGDGVVSETRTFTALELELGFLGDAVVGIVAAFSVFVVSSAVFPGTTEQDVTKIDLVHLIGWALVAGYLGPRLMRLITEKLGNIEAAQKTANQASSDASAAKATAQDGKQTADAAKASVKASEEAHPLIVEAQRLLTLNEVADLMKDQVKPADRKTKYLDKAEDKYKLALALHPNNVNHLIGLANVYYDMAELAVPATPTDPRDVQGFWKVAVETLEKALVIDPESAKARYNLACFKAKANAAAAPGTVYPEQGIFADLKKAYAGGKQDFQTFAYSDSDFDQLRSRGAQLRAEDLALIAKP